jgi:hypothetical protein
MRTAKKPFMTAGAGLFMALSGMTAQAGNLGQAVRKETSDISNLPLAVFFLAAILVYLCNRPRVTLLARSRHRRGSHRDSE